MSENISEKKEPPRINVKNRIVLLLKNYLSAKLEGKKEGYKIKTIKKIDFDNLCLDDLEEYYILFKPKSGLYKDQYNIIEMKTRYGNNEVYLYPIVSPKLSFISKVFHTNISKEGSICLDILKDSTKWSSVYDFNSIIFNILLLFQNPNNSSPFNGEASREYVNCEKNFVEQKKLLPKNSSLNIEEKLFEECFNKFKKSADEFNIKTDFKKFYTYFPELNNDIDYEEEKEINLLEKALEQIEGKKTVKLTEEESKKLEEEKRKNKFAKFQKKK